MHWRRKWQPTPVFLPGEFQGRGNLRAAIYGVAQSRTRLNQLSSSSSRQTIILIFVTRYKNEVFHPSYVVFHHRIFENMKWKRILFSIDLFSYVYEEHFGCYGTIKLPWLYKRRMRFCYIVYLVTPGNYGRTNNGLVISEIIFYHNLGAYLGRNNCSPLSLV